MLCVGLEVLDATGEIVMVLITLFCVLLAVVVVVVVICRGERKTVPVDKVISLLSVAAAAGLTTTFGVMLLAR